MEIIPIPNANPEDCEIIPIPNANPNDVGTVLLNNKKDEWDDMIFYIENDIDWGLEDE